MTLVDVRLNYPFRSDFNSHVVTQVESFSEVPLFHLTLNDFRTCTPDGFAWQIRRRRALDALRENVVDRPLREDPLTYNWNSS
jgi:hypothetical protein